MARAAHTEVYSISAMATQAFKALPDAPAGCGYNGNAHWCGGKFTEQSGLAMDRPSNGRGEEC